MATKLDDAEAAFVEPVELRRADTLNEPNPYRLHLSAPQVREVLDELGLHDALGFLVGALTIPEPLSWEECLEHFSAADEEEFDDEEFDDEELDDEELDDEELDDETLVVERSAEEIEGALKELRGHVQQRIAAGAVVSLIPTAQDAQSCDEWIDGFGQAACQTLHDLTDEEAKIRLVVFARLGAIEAPREQRYAAAREALGTGVPRLIEFWREVPPYDPEQDERRWSEVVPKRPFEPPAERVIYTGGTFVRTEAKVGRNDLCPCGSGKKYKKCCG